MHAESNIQHAAVSALQQIDFKWPQTEAARRMAPELRADFNSGDQAARYAASGVLQQLGQSSIPAGGPDESTRVLTAAGQKTAQGSH